MSTRVASHRRVASCWLEHFWTGSTVWHRVDRTSTSVSGAEVVSVRRQAPSMDGREVDAWDVRIPLGPPYQPVHHTLPTLTEALAWADAQLRADGWVFESADPGESGRSTAERVAQVREAHAALARAVEDLLAELDAPRVSAEPSAEEQTP